MLLQNLFDLVKTLQKRIDTRRNAISEWQTRYELIDPVLRELGWDTSDPEQVVVEYSLGKKRVDYALHKNGSPEVIVEAKSANASLEDAPTQAFTYSQDSMGARYFAVTNGVRWQVYDTHKPANEMMIVSFDLKEQSPPEVCLNALALWRPSVESGHVAPGKHPILSPSFLSDTDTATQPLPVSDGHDWKPFSELDPKTILATLPMGIRFPDGSDVSTRWLYSVVLEIVKWLSAKGKINKPIPSLSQGKLIVSANERHLDGSQMTNPIEVSGWFISKQGNRTHIMSRARRIIEHAGLDLAEFHLRFD